MTTTKTSNQTDELRALQRSLQTALDEAQSITMAFADEDERGNTFYYQVETKIEEVIYEIEGLLTEATND